MALTVEQQLDTAMRGVTSGDIDLLSKLLTDPNTITPKENRTTAQKLGLRGGLLEFVANTATDPVVWISMLMSRRFPTLGWLKGSIPQRFIGHNNEFTGISAVTRPVETFFRGTPVPRLVALAERRKAEAMRVGEKLLGVMNRPNWTEEMPIVSLHLDGQVSPGLTSELRGVGREVRGGLEELWGLLAQTQAVSGGFSQGGGITRASARPFTAAEAPRHLRDYLPHIPLLTDESIMRLSGREALEQMAGGRFKKAFQAINDDPRAIWSVDASDRLSSNFTRYQGFLNSAQGKIYSPHLYRRSRMDIPLQSHTGQELFVTDLNVLLQKYVHSVSRTYAVNTPLTSFERTLATVTNEFGNKIVPTADPIAVQLINNGLDASGVVTRRRRVAGTDHFEEFVVPGSGNALSMLALKDLVKSVRGGSDEGEIIFGNMITAVGRRFNDALGATTGRKPRDQAAFMLDTFRRNQQGRAINNGIASYFYSTTLGLNPWSALQNLLQPILTTGPALGIGPTLAGMRELRGRVGRYASEIRVQHAGLRAGRSTNQLHRINESAQLAFNKVFPELAEAGMKLDPRLFDINPNSVTAFGPRATGRFKSYDDFAKFLLQPFTQAELSNRATTFFAGRHAIRNALKTGELDHPLALNGRRLVGKELGDFVDFEATRMVSDLQFVPGPGSRTILQNRLPAWARQFTTFPTRALSHFVESTVRGAMTQEQLATSGILSRLTGGRNLGTLARTVLYGRLAANGAKDVLGVDLSNALGITAPFNVAPPGRPFAPVPVPPFPDAIYSMLSAATTRDIKKLQPMSIPGVGEIPIPRSLIPGGIGLSKAARALNQWRPDIGGFVDEDERLMYQGNTSDLILSMLGIPLDKSRRVRQAVERSQSVRTRVRQFRRQYALAKSTGDESTQRQLETQWSQVFKPKDGWPPLAVRSRDVRRYQQNQRMTLLQRTLKSAGEAGKILERDIYEVDPEIIAPPEALLSPAEALR